MEDIQVRRCKKIILRQSNPIVLNGCKNSLESYKSRHQALTNVFGKPLSNFLCIFQNVYSLESRENRMMARVAQKNLSKINNIH